MSLHIAYGIPAIIRYESVLPHAFIHTTKRQCVLLGIREYRTSLSNVPRNVIPKVRESHSIETMNAVNVVKVADVVSFHCIY